MATLATFFRRSDLMAAERTMEYETADPYRMRGLPGDNLYFFSKRIDNSRLVRQADPKTRTDCWSTIATGSVIAVMLATAVSPRIGGVMAGYEIEKLKSDQRELRDKLRVLEIDEAEMLNPKRLDELATRQKLSAPAAGQEVHLQPKDSSLALNVSNADFKTQGTSAQ